MPKLGTSIRPNDPAFRARAEKMDALVEELKDRAAQVAKGGGEKYQSRHVARGKLLPRDRIDPL